MPKIFYLEGTYYIKIRGRGITTAKLTKQQAKSLFEIQKNGYLEIESIQHINYYQPNK